MPGDGGARLDSLEAPVLAVLQAVAALGRLAVRDVPTVLGSRTDDVDRAVRAGVLVLEGGALRPADPDLGADALDLLPGDQRRALHARLARASVSVADAVRQRDLATEEGVDEGLAAALERAAATAEQAGDASTALELWRRAATRSAPGTAARNRRELRLAEQAHMEGRFDSASAILEGLTWPSLSAEQVEHAVDLLTTTAYSSAGLLAARLRVQRIHDGLPVGHPYRGILEVYLAGIGDDFGEARRRLEEALPQLRSDRYSAAFRHAGLNRLLYVKVMNGAGFDTGLLEELRVLERQLPDMLLEDTAEARVAFSAHVVDDLTASSRAIAPLLVRAATAGDVAFEELLLVQAAQVDVLSGRFASAARRLEQRQAVSQRSAGTPAATRAAGLLALELGDEEEVVRAIGRPHASGSAPMGQIARAALQGLLLARTGSPSSAVRYLQDAVDLAERSGIREPGRRSWVDVDLARASVRIGRLDRAHAIAASLRRLGEETARVLPALQAERIEAWLADAEDRPRDRADGALRLLRAAEAMEWIPERARITSDVLHLLRDAELDESARATVTGRARAALALLEDGVARRALERDLARWEEAELRVLTPAERRVTERVVSGMSNKEVADRLHLSIRTVESHLRNVYVKLGVESRTQLAARFALLQR